MDKVQDLVDRFLRLPQDARNKFLSGVCVALRRAKVHERNQELERLIAVHGQPQTPAHWRALRQRLERIKPELVYRRRLRPGEVLGELTPRLAASLRISARALRLSWEKFKRQQAAGVAA